MRRIRAAAMERASQRYLVSERDRELRIAASGAWVLSGGLFSSLRRECPHQKNIVNAILIHATFIRSPLLSLAHSGGALLSPFRQRQ